MIHGLSFANYIIEKQQNLRAPIKLTKFRSYYYVGPKAVTAFIKDLPPQGKHNFILKHLFMALSFIKSYNINKVHGDNWGCCLDKIKKEVKPHFRKLQSLKNKKTYISGLKNKTIHVYFVDGVHSGIREFPLVCVSTRFYLL